MKGHCAGLHHCLSGRLMKGHCAGLHHCLCGRLMKGHWADLLSAGDAHSVRPQDLQVTMSSAGDGGAKKDALSLSMARRGDV